MGSEWKTVPFGELYAIPSRNGLTKPKRVRGDGYKFINMGEIFAYSRMLNIDCDRAPATKKELETSTLETGDLLFARQSLVLSGAGKCSIFLGDDETTIFESHLIRVRPDAKKVLPEYLYYYFNSPIGRSEIWGITEQGAGQAGIRGSDLETVQVKIPSLSEQSNIVSVLSAIDNKIELNRQINTTLESMAQALFKSWFVDFDPVIDNALAAGNPIPEPFMKRAQARAQKKQELHAAAQTTQSANGSTDASPLNPLPAEIQQLFPSSFVFTEEMGWVPEGWEVRALSAVADFGTSRVEVGSLGLNNYISTENMLQGKAGVDMASSLPSADWAASYKDRDVLVSNIRPYFKKIWFAHGSGGRSNDVLAFEVKVSGTAEYLYNLLLQNAFFDYMMATSKGTKMPRGDKKAIMNWPVVVPPIELRKEFSRRFQSVYKATEVRNVQNQVLASARDLLLPKLLSGQVQISAAEQQLAEVI